MLGVIYEGYFFWMDDARSNLLMKHHPFERTRQDR